MSFTRVFSYPRLRNSFTAVSTICSRFLVSRSGADIGTLSAVLGRAMVHPNPGMLAVLPSLSADAVQSVRDYNIRATNVKVRSSDAVSPASPGPAWDILIKSKWRPPQERDPAEYGRARQILTLAGRLLALVSVPTTAYRSCGRF